MLKMRVSQRGRIMGLWFNLEAEKVDNEDFLEPREDLIMWITFCFPQTHMLKSHPGASQGSLTW